MLPYPLTTFEIQKCYQNEPKFNCVYSRNKLPKIKDGAYVLNFDESKSIGTHWIALYVNGSNIIYFVENTDMKIFTRNKNIIINTYRIQAFDLSSMYKCQSWATFFAIFLFFNFFAFLLKIKYL